MVDRMRQRGGSGGGIPQPVAPERPPWLDSIYDMIGGGANGYTLTPEDLQAIAYAQMFQQVQVGQGQNDYQMAKLDYDNDYLDYLGEQLGLSREQMAFEYEKFKAEQELLPWQMQVKEQELQNALALGDIELDRSKHYALSSQYQTDAARYGAEAAKYNWMAQTGQVTGLPQQRNLGYGYTR